MARLMGFAGGMPASASLLSRTDNHHDTDKSLEYAASANVTGAFAPHIPPFDSHVPFDSKTPTSETARPLRPTSERLSRWQTQKLHSSRGAPDKVDGGTDD